MSAPKRQRTTNIQTRSSVTSETSKELVGSPPVGSPPRSSSASSQSSNGSLNYQNKAESSSSTRHASAGIATRTRASSTTTTTRRVHSRSDGSVPDTSTLSSVNPSSVGASSSSASTSNTSEASAQNSPSVTHVDNATSNEVVQWIRDNYEEMMNSNVPRSGIYEHYRHFCALHHSQYVNAATFGKLIRQAFPTITTRRLGNRGQSKYQYCNIQRRDKDAPATGSGTDGSTETNITNRPPPNENTLSAPSSSAPIGVSRDSTAVANALADFYVNRDDVPASSSSSSNQATTSAALPPLSHDHHLRHRAFSQHPHHQTDTLPSGSDHSTSSPRPNARGFPIYRLPPPIGFGTLPSSPASAPSSSLAPTYVPNSKLLHDFSASSSQPTSSSPSQPTSSSVILSPTEYRPSVLTTSSPPLPPSPEVILNSMYSRSSSARDPSSLLSLFTDYYHRHCDTIFSLVRVGNFAKVEDTYKTFYESMPTAFRSLMSTPELIESIWRWDCVLYDSLIVCLLPKVDYPTTEQMISELRYFTKHLPQYLNFTLQSYPEVLKKKKVDVATIFVAKMRRHLTLNQFAIAAGDVVRQRALLEAMASDWKSLDIGAILDHVLWVCDCRNDTMHHILAEEIPHLLAVGNTLDQWMKWEQQKIDMFLTPLTEIHDVQNINEFMTQAKQFILKWKMYTGLVMQQFYIKGIKSIDSFKTLQFFFDDLILYHVEERIALINVNANKHLVAARNTPVNTPFAPTEQQPDTNRQD